MILRRAAALALAAVLALSGCQTPEFEVDRATIFFAENSADLDAIAEDALAKLAQGLRERPANDIAIEGYSEAGGPAGEGQVPLSERRAVAVARRLAAHGVPPEIMRTMGMGAVTPLALPLEGRRVDVTVQRRAS